MKFNWQGPLYIPPEGPAQDILPSREIYAAMGADNINRMLEDFYAELERSEIRPLFTDDMKAASRKSAAFFIGILGGPPVYRELYGEPMMRRRHMAFPISEEARQVWMSCFRKILADAPERYEFPAEHLAGFDRYLDGFSKWMVNRAS